jgi:predicted aldo/keto reductase-like oxidoreductase
MEKKITRRDFLKVAGTSSLALGAVAATGCSLKKSDNAQAALDVEGGKMEYRTNSKNGDKVSLLGFGCMRWPMIPGKNGEKDKIDQDAVNKLVDFAYKHGVNYYDTSPAYLQGQSETAAGIALSRYPRKSYYLATKLSNFNAWDKDTSIKMYHDSFEQLKTDYFDYYFFTPLVVAAWMFSISDMLKTA